MSESEKVAKKRKKKELSSSVADEGLRGLFTRLPLPGVNGHPGGSLSIQNSDEEERKSLLSDQGTEHEEAHRTAKELEAEKERESEEARMFRIQSIGSSEMSASVTVPHPVIKVTVDEEEDEKERELSQKREKELAGVTFPPVLHQPAALDIPSDRRRRGGSAGPYPAYGAMDGSINTKQRSPSPSPTPGRRRMRKTISGKSSTNNC